MNVFVEVVVRIKWDKWKGDGVGGYEMTLIFLSVWYGLYDMLGFYMCCFILFY